MNKKKIAKRTGSILLAALVLAGSAAALPSFVPETGITANAAVTLKYGNFDYTVSDNKVTIKQYRGTDSYVNIPSTINGYPVKYIGSSAASPFYNNKSIREVIIPYGVEKIGNMAFQYCSNLKRITIPNSVTELGYQLTFSDCSSLESITIPSGVTKIPQNTFSNCTSLKTVKLPDTITEIGQNAFSNCNSLTIYGKRGTIAETYAKNNGIPFIDNSKIAVTKVTLNKTSAKLYKGQSITLTATIAPSNATNKAVTWKTSDSSIATVSGGKVTAKKAGTATITAETVNGIKATCKVTVTNYIKLNKDSISLGKGETFKLTADKTVNWRTSNSKIVTVDKNGNIKAVGEGKAWVTAKASNGAESACTVTVKKAPTWVLLSKGVLTIKVGQKASLSANVAKDAACATRTFRTSNSSVVKMTKTYWTGEFVGVKPGVAYVTVRTYNGIEKSCKVTVTK